MLHFGAKPPFSFERLLEMCAGMIPDRDLQFLQFCGRGFSAETPAVQPTLKAWILFETGLRNELVKIRAGRKKIDPDKYLRHDGYSAQDLYHIAMNSHRIPSFVDAEKFLDQQRWLVYDEFCLGHYFDIDALIVYALKLCILLRWETVEQTDKQQVLERTLAVG